MSACHIGICDNEAEIGCHFCGVKGLNLIYKARGFDDLSEGYYIYECKSCHLTQTLPKPTPEALSKAYSLDYYGQKKSKFSPLLESWTQYAARRRASILLSKSNHSNTPYRILDIGSGRGVLLTAFNQLGHQAVGIERPDSPFQDAEHTLLGDLADLETTELNPGSFDLIVIWHVLEHLEQPLLTLQIASRLLAEEGSLFISVPNFGSWQAKLFKSNWFHLDLPRHLFHFTPKSLDHLLEKSGFSVVDKSTFALDQNLYGFLQSALNALFKTSKNLLYNQLKVGFSKKNSLCFLMHLPLVLILAPIAIIELILAQLCGQGATLTVRAKKVKNVK